MARSHSSFFLSWNMKNRINKVSTIVFESKCTKIFFLCILYIIRTQAFSFAIKWKEEANRKKHCGCMKIKIYTNRFQCKHKHTFAWIIIRVTRAWIIYEAKSIEILNHLNCFSKIKDIFSISFQSLEISSSYGTHNAIVRRSGKRLEKWNGFIHFFIKTETKSLFT